VLPFADAKRSFDQQGPQSLFRDPDGLRFLKIRSLGRKEYLEQLAENASVALAGPARDALRTLYEAKVDDKIIDQTIRAIYRAERAERRDQEPTLLSELYKVQALDWGGLYQNSLEKTIVDRYVKRVRSFDRLTEAVEGELQTSLRSYVVSSWYNHWTSIIIEDVFRDHPAVLPAVGLTKQIDFFWRGVPYDLKVTFLPEGYIKDMRRSHALRPEETELKACARRLKVPWDDTLPTARLVQDLWAKLQDHPATTAKELVAELRQFRLDLLAAAQRDPKELMTWFYENQGVRRFDSSNRLFLVLVDTGDFFSSWRLKRMQPLLKQVVTAELDSDKSAGVPVPFQYEDDPYEAIAHCVFVLTEPPDGAAAPGPA
jgi:hypothetical protein